MNQKYRKNSNPSGDPHTLKHILFRSPLPPRPRKDKKTRNLYKRSFVAGNPKTDLANSRLKPSKRPTSFHNSSSHKAYKSFHDLKKSFEVSSINSPHLLYSKRNPKTSDIRTNKTNTQNRTSINLLYAKNPSTNCSIPKSTPKVYTPEQQLDISVKLEGLLMLKDRIDSLHTTLNSTLLNFKIQHEKEQQDSADFFDTLVASIKRAKAVYEENHRANFKETYNYIFRQIKALETHKTAIRKTVERNAAKKLLEESYSELLSQFHLQNQTCTLSQLRRASDDDIGKIADLLDSVVQQNTSKVTIAEIEEYNDYLQSIKNRTETSHASTVPKPQKASKRVIQLFESGRKEAKSTLNLSEVQRQLLQNNREIKNLSINNSACLAESLYLEEHSEETVKERVPALAQLGSSLFNGSLDSLSLICSEQIDDNAKNSEILCFNFKRA